MSRTGEPSGLQPGLLSASAMLEWRCRQADVEVPRLPSRAILTHQSSLLRRRLLWHRDRSRACLSVDVRMLAASDGPVALVGCRGVGAPATAAAIEELAVAGVREIVTLDVAGSLVPEHRSGAIVMPDHALADDGTSPHYSPESVIHSSAPLTLKVHRRLEDRGVQHSPGTVWSTDAVYRETEPELAEARLRGATVADMETASVLSVAAALGIEAAAILVVADLLFDGWHPPSDMSVVRAQLQRLLKALPECFGP